MLSPATGQVVALSDVDDAVFSTGNMGKGFGLEPTEDEILSPVTGKVTLVAETKHALGIETAEGVDILVHMGIDTVELKGKPFEINVAVGQKVKAGQKVATMDVKQIQEDKLKATIMVVATNTADMVDKVEMEVNKKCSAGNVIGKIKLKKEE
ncbi:trehalose PTS II ABC [Liquorilactobacillus oeni DSM 19972]|uniref:Trehalose PTS II ABC n=1 Tax=Liquorilactobacillus oeni DSM 19972 TaxID=1423777 RepID=A0A0R1MKK0_9LACO|nr:trehalose PTS II ABC [Liquorilactobacillus oeni DSM 19972]